MFVYNKEHEINKGILKHIDIAFPQEIKIRYGVGYAYLKSPKALIQIMNFCDIQYDKTLDKYIMTMSSYKDIGIYEMLKLYRIDFSEKLKGYESDVEFLPLSNGYYQIPFYEKEDVVKDKRIFVIPKIVGDLLYILQQYSIRVMI